MWSASPSRKLIEWVTRYLEEPERYPVLAAVRPGQVRAALPDHPPAEGESLADILAEVPPAEHAAYRAAAADAEAVFLEAEMRPFLALASELAEPAGTEPAGTEPALAA